MWKWNLNEAQRQTGRDLVDVMNDEVGLKLDDPDVKQKKVWQPRQIKKVWREEQAGEDDEGE